MKKKATLKLVSNLLFFVGLIIITFFILLKDQDIFELIRVIVSAKDIYIILGILLTFLFYFMEAYNVRSILKLFGEKISILSALKFTFIGFFFSAITPAASGRATC